MDRREFLKNAALTAAGLAAASALPKSALLAADTDSQRVDTATKKVPDLIAVRNGEPVEMFRKGIEKLGGMKAFVKKGQKVVVKPNIGWDQPPENGANTNPELVGEIVRQCVAAGASAVYVLDHTCNAWQKCYKNSGIEDAVKKAGGEMKTANNKDDYVEKTEPAATSMKKALIHKLVAEADVYINVPVLKHHGSATMSCAMKNYMGIVWDRQWMHRNDLQQSIADSVLYRKPDLNIVDAYRVMFQNGPRGVSKNDVRTDKMMLLSRDIVAVDVAAAAIIKFETDKIPHIKHGETLGLGTMDLKKLKVERINIS